MTRNFHKIISTTLLPVFTLFSVLFAFQALGNDEAEKIQQEIKEFTLNTLVNQDASNIKVNVKDIDPRQKIPTCQSAYQYEALNFSPKTSNFSVKVSCSATNWFTYVNIALERLQSVVVATTIVSPGELLSSSSVTIKQIDVNRLRTSTFLQPDQIIGARAKKRMREGSIITRNMLCFVCKGDRVTISASINGLSIKTKGMALEDGNVGDAIKIENVTTDKVIVATVLKQGEVRVAI